MSTEELAQYFAARTYSAWASVTATYDARPYVEGGDYLPVSCHFGNAANSVEDVYEPCGDVLSALSALSDDDRIIEPDYHGSEEVGYTVWFKDGGRWKSRYYSLED